MTSSDTLSSLPTIQQLRIKAGLTQTQLAARAGVSSTTIANWEQNRAIPFLDQLRRVCAVLGVSIDRVALTPHERVLQTHKIRYYLRAQHRGDQWIGQALGVDWGDLPLTDPDNPYSQGLLNAPMDESDPETNSISVPVTWKWEEVANDPDTALDKLAQRITQALDRVYAGG